MYYNEIKETAKRPELLAAIAPFINPATIVPTIAIGSVFLTAIVVIKKLKSEKNKLLEDKEGLKTEYESENDFEPYVQPLNEPLPTVENLSDEALQKEMIRQTMSELGKRSAKARAARENSI